MEEVYKKPDPIIRTENFGKGTHFYFAGIDVSKALRGFSFIQSKENVLNPELKLTIDIVEMIRIISEVSNEDWLRAQEIVKKYITAYNNKDLEEFDSLHELAVSAVRKAIQSHEIKEDSAQEYIRIAENIAIEAVKKATEVFGPGK